MYKQIFLIISISLAGNRRQLESLAAQVDYQQYQLTAAYLTLTANIVTTAITEASLNDSNMCNAGIN